MVALGVGNSESTQRPGGLSNFTRSRVWGQAGALCEVGQGGRRVWHKERESARTWAPRDRIMTRAQCWAPTLMLGGDCACREPTWPTCQAGPKSAQAPDPGSDARILAGLVLAGFGTTQTSWRTLSVGRREQTPPRRLLPRPRVGSPTGCCCRRSLPPQPPGWRSCSRWRCPTWRGRSPRASARTSRRASPATPAIVGRVSGGVQCDVSLPLRAFSWGGGVDQVVARCRPEVREGG